MVCFSLGPAAPDPADKAAGAGVLLTVRASVPIPASRALDRSSLIALHRLFSYIFKYAPIPLNLTVVQTGDQRINEMHTQK